MRPYLWMDEDDADAHVRDYYAHAERLQGMFELMRLRLHELGYTTNAMYKSMGISQIMSTPKVKWYDHAIHGALDAATRILG
jgi:hypothetical protein